MISVIVPTLNEREELPLTLAALAADGVRHELIVVDGGSKDRTPQVAAAAGAHVVHSPRRQRAAQMNLGARHSTGSVLLFLHADTRLPGGALEGIERVMKDPQRVGGGFTRRFDLDSFWLRMTCRAAALRSKWLGLFFGDQAIFVRATVFAELNGYADLDLFEDMDLCRRLRAFGKTVCLSPPVRSSGRRFERGGVGRVILRDAWLTCRYLAGTAFGR